MSTVDLSAVLLDYAERTNMDNASKAKLLRDAKGSWMVAMALVMGQIADKMMGNIFELATKLGEKQESNQRILNGNQRAKPWESLGTPDKVGENQLTALMQSQSQLLNMFQQAMNTAMKTSGEALATVARKG